MKKLLILLLLLSSIVGFAQNAEFAAAATAFEEDNSAKALSILSQLEVKLGPNPKIESLRALSYNASGDNIQAYNSVLRYFKLAGRDNNAPGDADMASLEQTLRKGFENDLTKKKTELQNKRNEENQVVIDKINEVIEIAFLKVKKSSEIHFNNLIANNELTKEDIDLIKANIQTEAAQKLNVNVLKISTVSFSNILQLGADIDQIIDELYLAGLKKLKTDEYLKTSIKKEKGKKFKSEADYNSYLQDLKKDLKTFYSAPGSYSAYGIDNPKYAAKTKIESDFYEKYMFSLSNLEIACQIPDLSAIIGNVNATIGCPWIESKDNKIVSMWTTKTLSDHISGFTKGGELDLGDVIKIREMLERKYGVVKEEITKKDEERNFAKYIDYNYKYTVETKSLWYILNFHFGPYGYEVGNRDVIQGSTLRDLSVGIIMKQ